MTTALIIIDIQNDYFPGGKKELEGSVEASRQAAALLAAFRGRKLPVFHVQHIATRPGATFFLPDTEGAEIHPNVAPADGERIVVKHYPNSFRETTLLADLRQHDVTRLVVAGMMTHMCVDTTVRAAADLGYPVRLAHDACATLALTFDGVATPAGQVQAAYMAALDGSFAQVQSAQAIIDTL